MVSLSVSIGMAETGQLPWLRYATMVSVISRAEIDSAAEQIGVNPSDVQRDYVCGWLLAIIYGDSPLGNSLVLKGGNCLRKAYFAHGRYSGDLDFSCASSIANDVLGRELNTICTALTQRAGVEFDLDRTRVDDKRELEGGKLLTEVRVYFRDFYGELSQMHLKVKLDVAQFDRLHLPTDSRALIHPYSDGEACAATLRCMSIEEVLATKMRCLLQRRHIADFFDLVHGTITTMSREVDFRKLIYAFYKVTVFGNSPSVAKGLFVDLPFELLGRLWERYISCPKVSRLSFDTARDAFVALIDKLIPGESRRHRSAIFFPSVLRAPIMQAADTTTLLRLRYNGYDRLVEPYELKFMIRGDGVGREYLYVYDRSGGSSGPGIKTLVSEGVQRIENTEIAFDPRYEIQMRKAGGAEIAGEFGRR